LGVGGRYGNKEQPYTVKPLLHHTPATEKSPDRVVSQYARRGFTGFLHLPRSQDIPPITEAQAEALDALHFLAEKFSVTLDFQKGDVQYVNNLSIFHARDGFVDAPGRE
jgi:alpha-ketoglutarate-dependent taurine dioxygenase